MNDATAPSKPMKSNFAVESPSCGEAEFGAMTEIGPGEIIEWTVRGPSKLGAEPEDYGCGCGCHGCSSGGCGCSCV